MLSGVWNDKENRKKFFYHYAKVKGFDPHVPENWYSISLQVFIITLLQNRLIIVIKLLFVFLGCE